MIKTCKSCQTVYDDAERYTYCPQLPGSDG
jgi:hypothetical protein